MSQTVEAVYDGSVLRPEVALPLQPNTRVRLTIEVLPTVSMPPHDEWARQLLAVAQDCGVSLSDEALSRENLYD